MNWVRQVLGKIASKTRAIIVEEAMDLIGELEYDAAIRREYAHTVRPWSDESSCGSELLSRTGGFEAQENGEAHTSWALRDSVPEQQ